MTPPDYIEGLGRRDDWPKWFRATTPEQQSMWARWIEGHDIPEGGYDIMTKGAGRVGLAILMDRTLARYRWLGLGVALFAGVANVVLTVPALQSIAVAVGALSLSAVLGIYIYVGWYAGTGHWHARRALRDARSHDPDGARQAFVREDADDADERNGEREIS